MLQKVEQKSGMSLDKRDDLFEKAIQSPDSIKISEIEECGTSYLSEYYRSNYLGPPQSPLRTYPENDEVESLSIAGDSFSSQADSVGSLIRAKKLLIDSEGKSGSGGLGWTALRLLRMWADGLSEPHHLLKHLTLQQIENFSLSDNLAQLPDHHKALFWLEAAQAYVKYYEYEKSGIAMENALKLVGVKVDFGGALGKRTKFQVAEVAQLIVNLERSSPPTDLTYEWGRTQSFPHPCALNDDTLLETPAISGNGSTEPEDMNPIEQLILLTTVIIGRRSYVSTELSDREMRICIEKILSSPSNWSIQTAALVHRCELEQGERRRIERCLNQSEELVNQFSRVSPEYEKRRSDLDFAAGVPPIWKVQRIHAELLTKLGCTREALGIFTKLQSWDEVIQCYKSLGSLQQAERIVRDQLIIVETPKMLCYLGDITMSPEHYEKAWELSDHKNARSQRSLASLWMNRKQYDKAKDCFERSLAIEPLQMKSWHNLGYCAMQTEDYSLAASAYHRCSQLEPDNFEAWNNLSAAYVRLKQKDRAHKILQEALKYNFENWKVWDNFMVVSVDTGNFGDAIRAYHRLLDLRDKHTDNQVLTILARVATEDDGAGGDAQSTLIPELKKLFGRVTAQITNEPDIWRAYASLTQPHHTDSNTVDQWDKHIHTLQKAHQSGFQSKKWENDVEECKLMNETAAKLAAAQLTLSELCPEKAPQLKGSARIMLKSVIAAVRRKFVNLDGSIDDKLEETIAELDRMINSVS